VVTVSGLFIYPVKSCRGIALDFATVGDRGFVGDREWMVVDGDGRFLSQRTVPALARVEVALGGGWLRLHGPGLPFLDLPVVPDQGAPRPVSIWNDTCLAESAGPRAARWFSDLIGISCELVRMPETTVRPVSSKHRGAQHRVGFADGYPFLLLSEASLDSLNQRLDRPLPMDRFRPNIVVAGCAAHAEDGWARFRIGGVCFQAVKPCARCVVTTIDQRTGERGSEPLRTLAGYRLVDGKVLFGQNLVHEGRGTIRLGDVVEIR